MARRKRSALGEYIHLSGRNYLKAGIAHINEKPQYFNASERFLNNRISKIKNVNKSTIDLLKARLEQNADSTVLQENGGVDLNYGEKVNAIWEFLADITEQGVIGYGVGTSKNAKWGYTGDYQSNIKSKALTPEELERKKEEYSLLRKKIERINKRGQATEEELQEIVQGFESFNKTLSIDTETEKFQSIMAKLQTAMDNCYLNATKQALVGTFGEHYAAIADDYLYNFAQGAFIDVLSEKVVGNHFSNWQVYSQELSKAAQSYMTRDQLSNIFKVNSTQDKVDIEITVNGQAVYGSVKNYYDASKVTLQADVPLMATLVYLENREHFGTHWLNMHAGRVLRGNKSDRTRADEILEKEIGYEALVSGNPLKENQNQANVFIQLDRANGQVKVWSTKDLLLNQFHRLKMSPSISEILLPNPYSDTDAYARIAAVLMAVREIELSVSLSVL